MAQLIFKAFLFLVILIPALGHADAPAPAVVHRSLPNRTDLALPPVSLRPTTPIKGVWNIQLPPAHHFNQAAPNRFSVWLDGDSASEALVTPLKSINQAFELPVTTRGANSNLHAEVVVYYCEDGNDGLCLMQSVVATQPIAFNGTSDLLTLPIAVKPR